MFRWFSFRLTHDRLALVLCAVTGAVFSQSLSAQADDSPPALSHSDLSKFIADDGTLQPVRTPEDWSRRRIRILQGFEQAAGTLPPRTGLPDWDPQVTADERIGTVRRLSMSVVVEPGSRLTFDLYLPQKIADAVKADALSGGLDLPRIPAILALHPTGPAGRRIVAGEGGRAGRQYGLELALRGYVVLAPDYPSFGDLQNYDFSTDRYSSGTMKGIFNHIRCVDYLGTLPFVDSDRLGAIGHSLGGHNAIFAGVFYERLKVIVSSCGWCPFHDYYKGDIRGWTSDRYMPALRDQFQLDPDKVPFDFYELIAALAPRTFVSVSPVHDANFDIAGVRKAIPVAASIYSLLGARDELQLLTPDCEHDFPMDMRMLSYGTIDRVLKHQPDPFEPDYASELPRIPARSPEDAMTTFQVLEGFDLQQVAAEPLLTDPVAISFDADGRLFVVEMRDYSEQADEHLGRIRVLEDTDRDGRFDSSRVFAEGLSWPTAIVCATNGVFVGAPPDLYFLRDTDNDGQADEKTLVFTGFNRNNVQGMLNSFHWGPDNRIYGSSSTTGGSITCPVHPDRPATDVRGRDFSFDPLTLDLRTETGGGQHGMSFDDWGHRFVSANSDHAQAVIYDDRYLSRSLVPAPAPPRISIAVDGGQAPVFRISPVEPWRIVRTRLRASGLSQGIVEGGGRPAGYFTGATGITIYRGDAWPAELKGTAVIGDVGSNIVHRKRVIADGPVWKAERMDPGQELVASEDIWFRPVQFANAPDGCLYILDMYREVIEHPGSLPPEIKRHLDLTSGRDRGRLYRIAPAEYTYRPTPRLSTASTAELVAMLEHPNAWHRDTASRLLFERQDRSAVPALRSLLQTSWSALARFHAINCLEGLSSFTESDAVTGLRDSTAGVRERSLKSAERFPESAAVLSQLVTMTADPDARVRMQLGFSLGEFPQSEDRTRALTDLLRTSGADRWVRTAVLTSLKSDAIPVFRSLSEESGAIGEATAVLPELTEIVARQASTDDVWDLLARGLMRVQNKSVAVRSLEAAYAANSAARNSAALQSFAGAILKQARDTIATGGSAEDVAAVVPVFALSTLSVDGPLLLGLMETTQPPEVQSAAMTVLLGYPDEGVAALILERWGQFSPKLSALASEGMLSRPARSRLLLESVRDGRIPTGVLSISDLQRLSGQSDPAVRELAAGLLKQLGPSPREDVLRAYQTALALKGDVERGGAVFRQQCSICHKVGSVGYEVGPNLATMKNRGPEAILTNVLDPNREVNPAWKDYIAVTTDGVSHNGVVISESAAGLTLRRSEARETSLLRSDVEQLQDTGRSLMPEGLEKNVAPQAMADLIAWIMSQE